MHARKRGWQAPPTSAAAVFAASAAAAAAGCLTSGLAAIEGPLQSRQGKAFVLVALPFSDVYVWVLLTVV